MERYQIVEVTEELNHAGTKATSDIAVIADRLGFKRVNIKMDTTVDSVVCKVKRQMGYFRDWNFAEKTIAPNSLLLLQHPFHYKQITRKKTLINIKKKNVKIISLVHDVEELRAFRYNDYYAQEFKMMIELADVIIVHNEVMKKWFIEQGVPANKLISLEIFDYLQDGYAQKKVIFEKSITIAGNLDTTKCGYIGKLGNLDNVKVHLYGPNFDEELKKSENIEYHGSFPVDEIPSVLDRGFGLVWDGESIEGCRGQSGQYLRYNNPHKLSLYISSGIPVVIWREAAEAKFVEEKKVGFLIDNLNDLGLNMSNLKETEYFDFLNNVNVVRRELVEGKYAYNAISSAIEIIGDK